VHAPSGRPSALRRLTRRPLELVAIAGIAALALFAGTLGNQSQVRLTGEIDANWRGSYDLLVRPPGARLDLEATNGVVEPNFLGLTGQGGISVDQLNRLRSLPEVELAAPVGFVGHLRFVSWQPTIVVDTLPERPTLYEATIRATTSDGMSEWLVQRETGLILLGPVPSDPTAPVSWASNLRDWGWGWIDDQTFGFGYFGASHDLPAIGVGVLAVDPAAERQLLGEAGAFLDRFALLGERGQLRAETMDISLLERGSQAWMELSTINDPDSPSYLARKRPIVPLVVSSSLHVELKLELDVRQLGQPIAEYPAIDDGTERLDAASQLAGSGSTLIGSTTIDASSSLRPFEFADLTLPWPGSETQSGSAGSGYARLETRLTERPVYEPVERLAEGAGLSFRIESLGAVDAGANPTRNFDPSAEMSDLHQGRFPAYRSFTSYPLQVQDFSGPDTISDSPFFYAPIGTFDPTSIDLPTNPLNYVPLGAYNPTDTTYVADPSGQPAAPIALAPTTSAAGLVEPPPMAITDIEAAQLLRGPAPIDAVRVRVRGLSNFDAAAREKVAAVASQIMAMGLDVDIVAGSSPQQVDIYVPDYFVNQESPADLGWVRQHWTTIGAASRVEAAFGQTNSALILIALAVALTIAGGLQVILLAQRRRDVAILRAIGWPGSRIRRWLLAEAGLGALVIALMAGLGWLLGGASLDAALGALALGGVWLAASGSGSLWTIRTAPVGAIQSGEASFDAAWTRAVGVWSLRSFALRSLTSRPLRTASEVVGLGLAGAATALALITIVGAIGHGGPTLLSAAVGATLQPMQLAILGTAGSLAALYAVVATRLRLRADAEQELILTAVGWSAGQRRRVGTWTALMLVAPAALLAAATAAGLAPALAVEPVVAAALAPLASVLLGAVAWSASLARRR
jgi:hypothetical protein